MAEENNNNNNEKDNFELEYLLESVKRYNIQPQKEENLGFLMDALEKAKKMFGYVKIHH